MTSVERVKAICKDRKVPISKLEKDLGFANGYIGQLKKGVFPDDRLVAISKYLGVSVSELTGEQREKAPTSKGERELPYAERREIMAGTGVSIMLDADAKLTEEQLDDIINFIQFQQGKNGR